MAVVGEMVMKVVIRMIRMAWYCTATVVMVLGDDTLACIQVILMSILMIMLSLGLPGKRI